MPSPASPCLQQKGESLCECFARAGSGRAVRTLGAMQLEAPGLPSTGDVLPAEMHTRAGRRKRRQEGCSGFVWASPTPGIQHHSALGARTACCQLSTKHPVQPPSADGSPCPLPLQESPVQEGFFGFMVTFASFSAARREAAGTQGPRLSHQPTPFTACHNPASPSRLLVSDLGSPMFSFPDRMR